MPKSPHIVVRKPALKVDWYSRAARIRHGQGAGDDGIESLKNHPLAISECVMEG